MLLWLAWMSAWMPPLHERRPTRRYHGHTCPHKSCQDRGKGPGEAVCNGHPLRRKKR